MFTGEYVPPILTVDSVAFQLQDDKLVVQLIQRAREPFQGHWALPGGYSAAGETTQEALDRILRVKVGLSLSDFGLLEQLYTFDTVARDPRGHAVSVTYMSLGRDLRPALSNTTQNPTFFPVDALPGTAYDHYDIIAYALERLRAKITYTNAVFALLPHDFTLTQLQAAYEAILGRTLDKRNFRKKFLSLGMIEPTDKMFQEGAHRPARLYRFKQQSLQTLQRSFE